MRGGNDTLKSVDLTISIDKNADVGKADIFPRLIKRANGNDQSDWIMDQFNVFFSDVDKIWHVDCGDDSTDIFEARMLNEVKNHYKRRGFVQEEIAKMLGVTDNTFSDKKNKAEELLSENNIKD
ncbi:MAG: hypothetical protein IJJ33_19640 [Victivallales bacterium]|nr:hypothetical protein [Victivallales bacterium]